MLDHLPGLRLRGSELTSISELSFMSIVGTWRARPSRGTPLTYPPLGRAVTPPQRSLEWFLFGFTANS
ncbi:hypothetical protein JZ751_011300 [Albula glossodonta]|uniref:Uncharacterized protein n=1 Tax=Albula glossodonta TaxID=121402 RepID=A0A8T2P4X6_9TELE|nr:hypothetical protein JZ751_011300 [Albula glossodonta]